VTKRRFVLATLVVLVVSVSFLSCVSKEEKTFGKILSKKKDERQLIIEVQNAVFGINENLTLKEAVAYNAFSKNITWDITPAQKKGAYFISFYYDIDPLYAVMDTDIFSDDVLEIMHWKLAGSIFSPWPSEYREIGDSIISPIGEANMFTRFISSEIVTPFQGMDEEMREVLHLFEDYKKGEGYTDAAGLILRRQIPDSLPEPFFDVKSAKFIGRCFTEISSSEIQFAGFSLLFDFTLPYSDNKEYKGIGLNIYDEDISPLKYTRLEEILPEAGLEFVYEDKKVYELYPYACDPIEDTTRRR
jgi:hypothetical protein